MLRLLKSLGTIQACMSALRLTIVVLAATLAAPIAFAHHGSPFSTWVQFHADVDWTSPNNAVETGSGARFMTNIVCLGDAQSSRAGAADVTGFAVNTLGPHAVMGPHTGAYTIDVPAAAPECPLASGAGTITFSFAGRYEDHAPGNAVTVFGSYTVSGTGFYATVTGGGTYSMSFTGTIDPDSGWPTLLDGAFTGGTRY